MLINLLNGDEFLGFNFYEIKGQEKQMQLITQAKAKLQIHELCKGKAACLRTFAMVVFAMDFYASPNYDALQELLFESIDL